MLLKRIVWVHGSAGSGKSTVANSVAAVAKCQGRYLASFCCKRDKQEDWCSVGKVLLMLAYQIAEANTSYADAVKDVLRGPAKDDILKGKIDTQFRELFRNAIPRTCQSLLPNLIVIDALDECSGSKTALLKALFAIVDTAPSIKIFITSRYADELEVRFRARAEQTHIVNINAIGHTSADIRLYTEVRMRELEEMGELKNASVSEYIELLASRAGGLFVWSATVFRYLERSANVKRDLKILLFGAQRRSGLNPLHPLEDLYDRVLASSPYQNTMDQAVMECILGIVLVTSSTIALPMEAIAILVQKDAEFADEDEGSVGRMIRSLRAVLYEDERDGTVRAYHLSFLDFLAKRIECKGSNGLSHIHEFMFKSTLDVMSERLEFNICRLDDASLLNEEVMDLSERIARFIPAELDYSCQYWFTHLENSCICAADSEKLVSRLIGQPRALFWLEVLSITGPVERSLPILRRCSEYFSVRIFLIVSCRDIDKSP